MACSVSRPDHGQDDDPLRDLFERFVVALSEAGVEIVDRRTASAVEDLENLLLDCDDFTTDIVMYEARWPFVAYIDAYGQDRAMGDTAYSRLQRGIDMTRQDYRAALAKREAARLKVMGNVYIAKFIPILWNDS